MLERIAHRNERRIDRRVAPDGPGAEAIGFARAERDAQHAIRRKRRADEIDVRAEDAVAAEIEKADRGERLGARHRDQAPEQRRHRLHVRDPGALDHVQHMVETVPRQIDDEDRRAVQQRRKERAVPRDHGRAVEEEMPAASGISVHRADLGDPVRDRALQVIDGLGLSLAARGIDDEGHVAGRAGRDIIAVRAAGLVDIDERQGGRDPLRQRARRPVDEQRLHPRMRDDEAVPLLGKAHIELNVGMSGRERRQHRHRIVHAARQGYADRRPRRQRRRGGRPSAAPRVRPRRRSGDDRRRRARPCPARSPRP